MDILLYALPCFGYVWIHILESTGTETNSINRKNYYNVLNMEQPRGKNFVVLK